MTSFPFRTVVFDLDGTLADTAPDLTTALNHALHALGRAAVPGEKVRTMVGHGARALLQKGLAATGEVNEALIERGFPIFLDHYEAHICDASFPYPGVEAAMDALAADGVRLAVCTNKLEHLARLFIDGIGWGDRFAAIIGGDSCGARKPEAEPLLRAVELAGGGPAAFVGDSITDTDTARAAGIPCIAVTFGFSDRPPGELGATALIDHFDALIPALRGLGERTD